MKTSYKKFVPEAIILLSLFCAGCKHENFDDPGMKRYNLSQVKSVFIVNTTEDNDPENQTWVNFISAREASNSPDESEKVNTVSYDKGDQREFKINMNRTETGDFTCVLESDYCYIWERNGEAEQKRISQEDAEFFAKKFDDIYIKETALVGPKYDGKINRNNIVHNDKVSILFYDIDEDGPGNYTGFYQPSDMYKTQESTSSTPIECIHVDSCYARNKDTQKGVVSTLAHELNHKLNHDNKYVKSVGKLLIDSWYTEMLSMLVEDFFYKDFEISWQDSSQNRMGVFVKAPYVGFKNWSRERKYESRKYANAYAFGSFLARNYGGAELIHEIATNEFTNEDSVVAAVNKLNNTNYTFKDLLLEFPKILINNDNQHPDMPSLNKAWKGSLAGGPEGYEYELQPITFDQLIKAGLIKSDPKGIDPEEVSYISLGAYGFYYYLYDKPTDITLSVKEHLDVFGY